MSVISRKSGVLLLAGMLALPLSSSVFAQELQPTDGDSGEVLTTVRGAVTPPTDFSDLTAGPEIEGIISARGADGMQITADDGTSTMVAISEATEIKSKGGFLGLERDKLASDALLNGLPVTVETMQWGDRLLASKIDLKSKDLKTAAMIRNGTAQRFGEHDAAIGENVAAIEKNAAATDALRGRMGDIDKYNIVGTTNVYFDTGKSALSKQAEGDLCAAASQADSTENALLLVVGYTDSVGSQDFNQTLSEKRAGRVVNYLQQQCGWKPWRMLTPTGMAEADPAASNDTPQGKAQNRRVSVNILVSKTLAGL